MCVLVAVTASIYLCCCRATCAREVKLYTEADCHMFPPPPPSEMQYERIKNIRDSISCDISKYAAHLRPFGSCDTAGQCLCRSNGRAGRGVPLHCSPMGLLQGEAGSIMHVFASIIAAYRALYISGNMYLFSCTEMCVHLYTVALPCMKRVHTASCEPHLRSEHWCASQGCHRLSNCLLYTSPSPRDRQKSRMPSSA